MMSIAEKPYRVTVTRRSSQPGCYGWAQNSQCFATLEAAQEFAANVKRPVKAIWIDVAVNAETWAKNGRWRKVT